MSFPHHGTVRRHGIDPSSFRAVLTRFASGVVAVTGMAADIPVGLTVSSFCSVSLRPPLVSFCVARNSTSWPLIRARNQLCVNILGAGHGEICQALARSDPDKFLGIPWLRSPSGMPLFADVPAWIECTVEAEHTAGDHDIVVARPYDAQWREAAEPLVLFRGRLGRFAE